MLDKIIAAITSTEALAAFLGAFAAFVLEAIRRWRSDRLAELAAGNEAVFALSQMFTHISEVYRQNFMAYAEAFKAERGRDPNYSEILPIETSSDNVPRLRFDKLGFLLRSHDPDVLNRLAVTALDFDVLVKLLDRRNAAHLEWQQESARVFAMPNLPNPVPFEVLETNVGIHRSFLLRHMTDGLKSQLPECAANLEAMGKQLSDVLSLMFPIRRVSRFERKERTDAVVPPVGASKARLWRRLVRAVSRVLRIPIRLPRTG